MYIASLFERVLFLHCRIFFNDQWSQEILEEYEQQNVKDYGQSLKK